MKVASLEVVRKYIFVVIFVTISLVITTNFSYSQTKDSAKKIKSTDLWKKIPANSPSLVNFKKNKPNSNSNGTLLYYVKIRNLKTRLKSTYFVNLKPKKIKLVFRTDELRVTSEPKSYLANGDLIDASLENKLGLIDFKITNKASVEISLDDGSLYTLYPADSRTKEIFALKEVEIPESTRTATATSNPALTSSPQATSAPTSIPTAVVLTPEPTATEVPTAIPNTPTSTFTPSNTPTSTYTFTPSRTPTATSTRTFTPTYTFTFTPTATTTPAPASWFTTNIVDPDLRTLGNTLYQDNLIDRNDMIALLRKVEESGTVSATQFNDLKAIAANASLFGGLDYVKQLSNNVINSNVANAKYQGAALGNLAAGSSADQLEKLLSKWFLGKDHPTADVAYGAVSGSLIKSGAAYTDINQGMLGDCYLMTSAALTAHYYNSRVSDLFIDNGDGTYTLKFYNSGAWYYVTVDNQLPLSGGRLYYASINSLATNINNELWVALLEKAYVQLNELGWTRPYLSGNGINSYSSISGGYIFAALNHVSGQATTAFISTSVAANYNDFVTAYNQGKAIGFASKATPPSASVVGNHAYTVVSADTNAGTVTLFNPWGISYGLLTLTWAEIQANFSYFDRT